MAHLRLRPSCGALLALTTAAALIPATALAAHPITATSYTGSATQYYNNTSTHAYSNRQPTKAQISFKVASNGQRVLDFSGHYTSYCVTGIASVADHWISVDQTGFFSVSGSYPSYGSNHQRTGTTYATIKGQFIDGGREARIFYRVTTHLTGSSQPACGTQVVGTVHAG